MLSHVADAEGLRIFSALSNPGMRPASNALCRAPLHQCGPCCSSYQGRLVELVVGGVVGE